MHRPLCGIALAAALCLVVPTALAGCTSAGHQPRSASPSPPSINPDDASASSATSSAASSATGSAPATPAGSGTAPTPNAPTPTPTPAVASATNASPSAPTPTTSAPAPRFSSAISTVTAAQLGASWHSGCPVAPAQLRQISLSYWDFNGHAHTGTIVVNASVVTSVIKVFAALYAERFPIRRMEPVSNFGGSDDASMAVDNTSGFNCRNAVTQGPPAWSAHAYGKAIDVNTIENPYLEGGKVLPPEGAPYAKRTPFRPGMAVAGGQLVKAFAAIGWSWGGRWTSAPDYQHFSSTGG